MRQPAGWLVTLVIAAMLVLLACVLVFPRLLHPQLSAADLQGVAADKRVELQQAQARLQNDVRATLLQGVAGLLLVAGAIATWRQIQVSREGQITERFTRAIDQLGSAQPEVRLGGIYALERIAKDSPADRRTVVAVLAALVRTHAPWMVGAPNGPEHPSATVDERLPWLEHRAVDVQAALWVLSRRPPSRDPLQLYLSRVDLRAAFLRDARLPNTALRHANLARALMPGIDLSRSDLEDTDLRNTDLRAAQLTHASLYKAHLQNADLGGANLQRADLRGANLQGANLQGADLIDVRVDAATVWPDGFSLV
jgi:Pentapeptide repeats (8 copies)